MLLELIEGQNRAVINGLEGCGKSSQLFNEINDIATPDKPIIFAFKNYKLMQEQMESWSKRFNIHTSDFAICGFNQEYEPAKDVYTNKQSPWVVPHTARFVFISQGLLQRNRIRDLTWEYKLINKKKPIIQKVIIDEFDFTIGIIPTLDYFINHCPSKELKEKFSKECCDYIFKNYTREDVYSFQRSQENKDQLFNLAFWIEDLDCQLIVLTSEILASTFLEILEFKVVSFGEKNFHGKCMIDVAHDKHIGRNFFSKMNSNFAWNRLGVDAIISDSIASGIKDVNSLEIEVINHTSARGSNSFIDKEILTVVSYIPKSKIEEIRDCINCFVKLKNLGEMKIPYFKYNEVEALFYRDRLCQAIGRVIGYRGSVNTKVLVHTDIWKAFDDLKVLDEAVKGVIQNNIGVNEYDRIKSFSSIKFNDYVIHRVMNGISLIPYDMQHWKFEFSGKEEIWESIKQADERSRETGIEKKKNFIQHKKAICADNLNNYFELDVNSTLSYEEINQIVKEKDLKSITGKGNLQPAKLAKHFNVPIRQAKINGKMTRVLVGIKKK